jgi:hypothetical protein
MAYSIMRPVLERNPSEELKSAIK